MNLSELRTALQARGYALDTTGQQDEALNAAYRRLAGLRRWSWLEAAVTATATVGAHAVTTGLPADWRSAATGIDAIVVSAPSGAFYRPQYLEPQRYRDAEAHDDDGSVVVGAPDYWSVVAGQLRLTPAADLPYSVRIDYIKALAPLVNDADTPAFDATYHDVLVYGAIMELAARERDATTLAWAKALHDETQAAMVRAEGFKQRQHSARVEDAARAHVVDAVGWY